MIRKKISRKDNGGPPLEDREHVPEWGRGGFKTYFGWKDAHRKVWRSASLDIVRRRAEKAGALGLTYEEYVLEILERGRYLQAEDAAAIEAIKARRKTGRRA